MRGLIFGTNTFRSYLTSLTFRPLGIGGPRRIILVAHPEFYVGPFHGEQTMTAALSLFAAPYEEDVSAR